MVERNRYKIFDEYFREYEDYDWDFLMFGFMRDKDMHSIYPEMPRLKHIGKKGTTVNKYHNDRYENLAYTTIKGVH